MSIPKYKLIVRKRDRVCQICGQPGTKKNPLVVHHRKPKCQYPELAEDPNNCVLWHKKYHQEWHKANGYPSPRRR